MPVFWSWSARVIFRTIGDFHKTHKERMLEKLGRAIETVDNSAYNRVSRRGTL